jgi:hypothetical protein
VITRGTLREIFEDLLGTRDVDRWAVMLNHRPEKLGAGLAGSWLEFRDDLAGREKVSLSSDHAESAHTGF